MNALAQDVASVLADVRHILLDFDGPVCSVFAGFPASDVARRLLDQLPDAPDSWAAETDPLALLRHVSGERPDLISHADECLTRLEVEAARRARPTPGGAAFVESCVASGRSVWVVSNNATTAIAHYLTAHDLDRFVAGRFGRVYGQPDSMKPSPRLLVDAMRAADAKPTECVFVGDAVRDVEAASAVGMGTIGYANKPGKDAALANAGAVAVVNSMEDLVRAVVDTAG